MPEEAYSANPGRNCLAPEEARKHYCLKRPIILTQDAIAWRLKRRANTHSLKRLIILIQDVIAWRQAARLSCGAST